MLHSTLKRLARLGGLLLVRQHHAGARYLEHPPGNTFEDVLFRTFPDLHSLNFLQVGANDGRRADPIASLIDTYGWSGLMLEPLPANFSELQRHRGADPRLQLRQVAIDATAGRRPLYDLKPDLPGLPDWARGLASFSRERLVTASRELGLDERAIIATDIITTTWTEVWHEFGPRRCDVLVIDAEGHDISLLRLAGLATHRPRVIHFEHACADVAERLGFYRELLELGYELATYQGDTIASLPAP